MGMNKELAKIEETMSSKQITELLKDVRHDNVKVTMERLQDRGVINFTAMQENPTGTSGRPGTVYLVNERDSYIVVAQLSPEFAAAIVDHWRMLRGENADLKAQLAEQGRKIDMLCTAVMNPVITVNPVEEVIIKRPTSKYVRSKHIRNYDVIKIKALHSRQWNSMEICEETGFGYQTVNRVLRGERDHLLKA